MSSSGRDRIVVLNVDDYEAGRYATSRALRQAGYDVMEAGTGQEAIRLAAERPDLVVLDVNLPDVNGFEVCRQIKADPATAGIPVLYLSAAYRGSEHRVQGLEMGADAYLTQPVDSRELVATVNALLRARQVRDAVERSETRFRSLMTATSDIIWTTDPQGNFHGDQPDWAGFTGQGQEELRGWGWLDRVHPDDRERVEAVWRAALDARTPYETELRIRRQDGAYRHMLVRAVPVPEDDGSVREWVGACTDITERREAEQALHRYTDHLREMARASLAINSARSLDETLRVITEHARRLVGAHQAVASMTADQSWAQSINAVSLSDRYRQYADYTGMPDGSGIYALVCETNRPLRMTQAELEAHPRWRGFGRHAPEHPPMNGWLAVPMVSREGSNLGLIQLSDKYEGEFTEQDEAVLVQLAQLASVAVENARLLEETQAANQAKSDFLATMSHELRTPLNAMVGYTDLLLAGVPVPVPDPARTHVERIRGAALHLTQLIEEVLTHARIEAGRDELHLQTIDLGELITEVAGLIEPLAHQKGLRFAVDRAGAPARVDTDARKLRQILLNLLGNAVKFTERGEVGLAVAREGQALVLRVRDTGIGIPPAYLDKVFEPFWQVDGARTRAVGGTGLGLGVVRQLVERLGGEVGVESEAGRGSTFTVRMPLRPPSAPEPAGGAAGE